MRRFHVSSPTFNGQAEIVYDERNVLVKIDTTGCDMSAEVTSSFKQGIPSRLSLIKESLEGTSLTVIESEYEVAFEDFIRDYPYKRNTHLAKEFWPKMRKSDQIKARTEAPWYRKYCDTNKEWYNPMLPETWLKKKEYLNNWKSLIKR